MSSSSTPPDPQPSSSSTLLFNLLIKNPTDRPGSDPFTVQLPASSTVLELKQRLSESYPASPPVHSQRLIYAGKLLDNRTILNKVIACTDPSLQHTLHLVVSTPNDTTASPPPPRSTPNPPPNVPNPFMPAFPQPLYPQQYILPPIPTLPGQPPPVYNIPYNTYPPPPSDSQNENQPPHRPPFAPIDPSAYAAHLQAMERILADNFMAHQNNIQGAAQGANQDVRAAAAFAAASAAIHAQAHAQALAAQIANQDPPYPQNGIAFDLRMARPNQNNPPPPPDPANPIPHQQQPVRPGEPRVRQFVFQFELNWSLISKLILLVILLAQEGSSTRVYTLSALAVAAYLWQTGRLAFLRRFAGTMLPNPAQLVEILFPREPAPETGDANPDEQAADSSQRPRVRNRFGRLAVILSFVYSFLYGFICSLLPAWRPVRMPDMDEVINLNANRQEQNEEQPPPQPANRPAPNGDHEHAD